MKHLYATIQMKAIEQYFHVVLLIFYYAVQGVPLDKTC